jgi:pyruvate/2-oxoglutarate dehydrogenase complex dihydrolipoamide acyltransferase (E2) component
MAELKHVGRVVATNKKCIVAYRTLPGDAYHCLIVPTESLPDIYHDSIINLVESGAGQDAYEFAETMARSQFPDGANMLRSLHNTGRLVKAPTGSIEMVPAPNSAILLSELNQIIAEQRGLSVDDLSLKSSVDEQVDAKEEAAKAQPEAKTTKPAPAPATTEPTSFDNKEDEAKFYRSQADKLSKQAAEMRRKAEDLVPTKKKATK